MTNRDPFLSRKFKSFKETTAENHGPNFLIRMEKDKMMRKTITKIIDSKIGVEDVLDQARQSNTQFDEKAIDTAL